MKNDIPVEQLLKKYPDYRQGVAAIEKMVSDGILEPVKSSRSNGKTPALYKRYRRVSLPHGPNRAALRQEAAVFPPFFDPSFYLHHFVQFEKDLPYIHALMDYLENDPDLSEPVSENERSFEIWKEEKFLVLSGWRILKNLGLDPNFLHTYQTCEPICYFASVNVPGPVLIVENLDPFVACRKILNTRKQAGIVIYGVGKKIISSMQDFLETPVEFLKASQNRMHYLGDLDWEGISIYDSLCLRYPMLSVALEMRGYRKMIQKARPIKDQLPKTKEGQIPRENSPFFDAFTTEEVSFLKEILHQGQYIPQEILSARDYEEIL